MYSTTIAVLLLLGSFLLLMFLRVPIALSIGIASILTSLHLGIPLDMVMQNIAKGVNSYSLMAIPFFILMGDIMSKGGIAKRLINLAYAAVGWMRGGMAMVTCVASMLFGAVSGSSTACTATMGPIMIPTMNEQGYDKTFATNITMASSVTGLLIPPSHNLVIYAMAAGGVSVGKLFMGGIVPGIILGVMLMVYSYYISRKYKYPVGAPFNSKKVGKAFIDAIWGLLTLVIVVIGVTTGIITATESAAIATLWALFVSLFIYKEMSIKDLGDILRNSSKTLAMIMLLVGSSSAFGWLLAYLKVPQLITSSIFNVSTNPIIVLLVVNVLLLILGCLMDMSSVILIATPILLPIVSAIGMTPVQFGIVLITNLGIGLLTPPVGATLFVGSAVSDIKFEKLAKNMIPIYGLMVLLTLLITFVPAVPLFIPNMMK
ncbi:TRAP transporter large permease [Clostridium cochlearium]|uniref:TRAP dicarboxylate transporter subunit DctM n=1 Tax=Clostridium cochlearium TaxID=1494 RepID=A0A2X2W5E4_CLOCO|nr:TRAP transporter large permease [Clostridium cochlearium]MBU5269508.1 TRAP transporter large permease [Clostridium cochlearium]SQB33151.1 TRAP dicarboxylate transporter subunit DctM [Clostridium cochlearium]